jgi:hypothetical protein
MERLRLEGYAREGGNGLRGGVCLLRGDAAVLQNCKVYGAERVYAAGDATDLPHVVVPRGGHQGQLVNRQRPGHKVDTAQVDPLALPAAGRQRLVRR